jgi:hypothetical protein
MKIAIIGAGHVGKALGSRPSAKQDVSFAVRDVPFSPPVASVPVAASSSSVILGATAPFSPSHRHTGRDPSAGISSTRPGSKSC